MWCDGGSLDAWYDKHDDDTISYLHGYCDEWVRKHYLEGDQCIIITEYDYEIGRLCLLHSCLFRNGMYVDVRGETNDFEAVLDAFDCDDYDVEIYDSLDEFEEGLEDILAGNITGNPFL